MGKSYRIQWPESFGRCWMANWLTEEQQTEDWKLVQDKGNEDGFSVIQVSNNDKKGCRESGEKGILLL